MNKIKRAIIVAAGQGKRLRPLTLSRPKPLISVHGVSMIDTIIAALHQKGIYEIYVVVGYLADQFKYLESADSGIKLVFNPYFETCNNVSSLYMVRNYLEDVIILDGDQIVTNPDILYTDYDNSGYNAVWVDQTTDEWLMKTDDRGRVSSCSRNGGKNGWQLFSISRWNAKDGQLLRKHLEFEFEVNENRQIYWDDIPMFIHSSEYNLSVYRMKKGDVIEIDSLDELREIDDEYREV